METLSRVVSSKGWSYFWIAFAVTFMVLDLMSGQFVFAALMFVIGAFHVWDLNKKLNGTHYGYNRYHGEEV